jgi:hypothetical protein
MEYEAKQLILRELEAGERRLPSGIEIDFEFLGSLGIAGNAPRCCGLGARLKLWQAEVDQTLFCKGIDLCRQ